MLEVLPMGIKLKNISRPHGIHNPKMYDYEAQKILHNYPIEVDESLYNINNPLYTRELDPILGIEETKKAIRNNRISNKLHNKKGMW